jgi:hypothetical protein
MKQLTVKVPDESYAAWKTAAWRAEESLSDWVRRHLDAALAERDTGLQGDPEEDMSGLPGGASAEGNDAGLVSRSASAEQETLPSAGALKAAAPAFAGSSSAKTASPEASPKRKQGDAGAAALRARTKMCEHRVPAGTWCKRCDG